MTTIGQTGRALRPREFPAGRLLPILALACFGLNACAARDQSNEQPPESARALVTSLERQVVFHLLKHDRNAAANVATLAMARPDVRWVVIQDADGQILADVAEDGADGGAIRTEIVRLAWQPAAETWIRVMSPDGGWSHDLGRPLTTGRPDGADPSGTSRRLGTIHVGFGATRHLAGLDRLVARARTMTTEWTSPLRRDLTTRSRQALSHYWAGVRAARQYYEGEARTAWLMALEEDPHFAMPMIRLARLAHELNDENGAAAWHRRAEAEAERVTEKERLEILRLGADLEGREEDERAIEAEMIRRFDEDAELLLVVGNQHLSEGRPSEALVELTKALRLDPDLWEAWNLVGYAESELGHWSEAEDAFEKYAFLGGNQANPHDSLGEFYLRTGHYGKALAQIESAIVIKPDFAWAYYHLALANAELGRWEAAIFAIQRARDVSRKAPEDIAWSRAEIHLNLRAGRVDEAVRLLAVHRQEFPLTPGGRALAIQVALAEGNIPGARTALEEFQAAVTSTGHRTGSQHRQATDEYLMLEMEGLLYRGEGKPDAAIERLDAARRGATSWEARLRIDRAVVETLVAAGRHDEAIRRLEARLARNPDDPIANVKFGQALEMEGRHEEARAALERAHRVLEGSDPDNPMTVAVR